MLIFAPRAGEKLDGDGPGVPTRRIFAFRKALKTIRTSGMIFDRLFDHILLHFGRPAVAQDVPKAAQDAPKGAQDDPKATQDAPKTTQEGPKAAQHLVLVTCGYICC